MVVLGQGFFFFASGTHFSVFVPFLAFVYYNFVSSLCDRCLFPSCVLCLSVYNLSLLFSGLAVQLCQVSRVSVSVYLFVCVFVFVFVSVSVLCFLFCFDSPPSHVCHVQFCFPLSHQLDSAKLCSPGESTLLCDLVCIYALNSPQFFVMLSLNVVCHLPCVFPIFLVVPQFISSRFLTSLSQYQFRLASAICPARGSTPCPLHSQIMTL